MILTTQKKLIFIIVFFGLFATMVSSFIIYPTIKDITEMNKDTEELKEFLEKRRKNIMDLKTAKEKAGEIKEDVAYFSKFLFIQGQELALVTNLENIAKENNVEQKINNFENKNERVLFSIEVNGDYLDILNYLKQVETMDYFIKTDYIRISQKQEDKKNLTNLRLDLSLYVTKR